MMIKFLRKGVNCRYFCNSFNGLSGFSSYCTKTQVVPPLGELYWRIYPHGDPKVSIVPILDQWIHESRSVEKPELVQMVKSLRKFKRFSQALQLSEWMTDRRYLPLTPGDVAVRLELISRVRGIEEAEKYFSNIPNTIKTHKVYSALLCCYVQKRLLEKAETVMEEMRDLGYISLFSYNIMLSLYSKLGNYKKMKSLILEMEEKDIIFGTSTLFILLHAFSADANIESMEKVMLKLESAPSGKMNWHFYLTAANGYVKAGLIDKSSEMLKKAEKVTEARRGKIVGRVLITMYASLGKRDEVYRVWNLIKEERGLLYNDYMSMISSLIKLNDMDGAEEIWRVWESPNKHFDFRILNLFINAYIESDMLEKAEALVNKAVENGKEPPLRTWDFLASGYCKNREMEKAFEAIVKAISAYDSKGSFKLNCITIKSCLEYLNEKGETKRAEEFERLLEKHGLLLQISSDTANDIEDESLSPDLFDDQSDPESDTETCHSTRAAN